MATCKVPKCSKEAAHRGLCKTHYTTAARLVRENATTWLVLENRGKVLGRDPKKNPIGRPLEAATKWLLSK